MPNLCRHSTAVDFSETLTSRVISDPNGRHNIRCIADEPSIMIVVGRTGFAGRRPADGSGRTRTSCNNSFEHTGHFVGRLFGYNLSFLYIRRVIFQNVAVAVENLYDSRRFYIYALIGKGPVSRCHFQRGDALGQTAEGG